MRRQSPFIERNREIMQRVLNGETLQSVADAFGLNHQRVHQITMQECRHANPTLYGKMKLRRRWGELAWLRKRKTHFLSQG